MPIPSCTDAGGASIDRVARLQLGFQLVHAADDGRRPLPPFPTATTGGRIQPGTYWYDVTAVTSNGEFSGTPTPATVPAGSTTNTITVSWSAYTDPSGAAATSYRIYGRDNGSTTAEGLRLLADGDCPDDVLDRHRSPTHDFEQQRDPSQRHDSRGRHVDVHLVAEHDLLRPVGDRDVHREDGSQSFTGCTGGLAGTYPSGTNVFQDRTTASPVDAAPPLATLNVSLVLDQTPANTSQRFTLSDAISLRNSGRF